MEKFDIKLILISAIIALAATEPVSKRSLVFSKWPPKSVNQINSNAATRNTPAHGKRTLVVQIRSDNPVPIVLKRGQHHRHHTNLPHHQALMARPIFRPVKIVKSIPKTVRKPAGLLKIKLPNTAKHVRLEKPYNYEKPIISFPLQPGTQNSPFDNGISFIADHFAPIHTIPAPDLGIPNNHINQEDLMYLPPEPKPQPYHSNQYQVTEEHTNDQTILDLHSGKHKLFAPDPDPSLPTAKIRPATEPFNTPSNGHPLPTDVQSNYLPPAAQPLIQIVGAQQQDQLLPEIYPIQFSSQAQIQPFLVKPPIGVQPVPLSVYNPTYLVTQSNNLYTQHKQQLFKPNDNVIAAGYVNADLTQQVASNGQILQAAKDPINNIHPVLDTAPQFAALVATPPYHQAHALEVETAPFHLTNSAAQGGFVVSNYFTPDSIHHPGSQLLQNYAEQEPHHHHHQQQLNNIQQFHHQQVDEQNALQELQEQHLLLQQEQNHHLELQQTQQQQQAQQHQQQQQHQQAQQHQQQQQQHQQHQQQQQQQIQQHQPYDPVTAAYEEHQRLLQQQLGESPLRIFVPDEGNHSDGYPKLQKRSDNLKTEVQLENIASKEN